MHQEMQCAAMLKEMPEEPSKVLTPQSTSLCGGEVGRKHADPFHKLPHSTPYGPSLTLRAVGYVARHKKEEVKDKNVPGLHTNQPQ